METLEKINHPYMKVLEEHLTTHKLKIECLEKRLVLIDEEYKDKNDFQKNEAELIKLSTIFEINASKKALYEKEQYYIKFMASYIEDIEEVESNYDNLLSTAKTMKEDCKEIRDCLDRVNLEAVEKNSEVKIQFYKKLKKIVALANEQSS